jgi:tRNA(Leu) C34 or U34 (ribose-2'-O)-methylase TrmL
MSVILKGLNDPLQLEEANRPQKRKGVAPSVILISPKYPHNVGNAIRACSCWGMKQLWWTGDRVTFEAAKGERLPQEERMKGYRHVELFNDQRPFDQFDDATPVAVELRPGSEMLHHFEHPEKAVYVFGPEDGSIPKPILHLCHRFVVLPTHHCLNLASAVNCVLYDRRAKRIAAGLEDDLPLCDLLHEHRGPIISST